MNIEIANRLVNLRKAHHLSQEQLAEKVGVSRQAVSKWERAEASPDTDNLIILSKLYGMSLDAMLFTKEEPELLVNSIKAIDHQKDERHSQGEGNSLSPGWERNGTNSGFEGNSLSPGWEGNGTNSGFEGNGTNPGWERSNTNSGFEGNGTNPGWERNGTNSGFEGNGENPGFQRNWGAAERKKISKLMHAFPYPVFITMVYLVIGFLLGLWHPGWLIYLTVPMYYMLADAIGKVDA